MSAVPPRPTGARARVFDVVLAVLVLGAGIAGALSTGPAPSTIRGQEIPVAASALLQSVPLLWRRTHPVAVFVAAAIGFAAYEPLASVIPPFGFLIALYSLGAYEERRRSAVVAAAGVGALSAYISARLVWIEEDRVSSFDRLSYVILSVGIWLIGTTLGTRRAYTAALEERAALLEGRQEEQAKRAVVEERARIARELHDVVAHHVSTMVVQTGAARRVMDAHPEQAREALGAVEAAGRQALTEMRRMLGVLRGDSEERAREPQPGVDRLYALVDQVSATGVNVALSVEGAARALPPGVDLSAYRIVQEALTNVIKHADAANARVVLRYTPDAVEVLVEDDGAGGDGEPRPGGHGIVGMRERVGMLGGTLHAARGPEGFTVRAVLPIGDPAP